VTAALLAAVLGACSSDARVEGAEPTQSVSSAVIQDDVNRSVLTQHNDNGRSGAYLYEGALTASTVSPTAFGRLFEREVDGYVRAQPLYVRAVSTPSGTKNLIVVVTTMNSVYAYDADAAAGSPDGPIWHTTLGTPVVQNDGSSKSVPGPVIERSNASTNANCGVTGDFVGIMSTPVIDSVAGGTPALYVVARNQVNGNGAAQFQLFKLDLTNNLKVLASLVIDANLVASMTKSSPVAFNPELQYQRAGLLLNQGVLSVGFGGVSCDQRPHTGWVMRFAVPPSGGTQFTPQGAFVTSGFAIPGGSVTNGAAVWQSGAGLAADANGDVYAMTGNADNVSGPSASKLDESFLRIRGTTLVGSFRPANADTLNGGDVDLGSGGPMLIPGTTVLVGGGKQGLLYTFDTSQFQGQGNGLLQHAQAFCDEYRTAQCYIGLDPDPGTPSSGYDYDQNQDNGPNIHGGLAFWRTSSTTGFLYGMGEKDYLRAFPLSNSTLTFPTNPTLGNHAAQAAADGMTAGAVSVSANGTAPGSGIVWLSRPNDSSVMDSCVNCNVHPANLNPVNAAKQRGTRMGKLIAYNATPVNGQLQEIWRDDAEVPFAKFVPPTVADGKVFRVTGGENLADSAVDGTAASGTSPAFARMGSPNFAGRAHLIVYGQRANSGRLFSLGTSAAVSHDPSFLDVFGFDYDGSLVTTWQQNEGSWNSWNAISPGSFSPRGAALSAVTNCFSNAGRMEVFAANNAGLVQTSNGVAGNGWSNIWTTIPDPTSGAQGVVVAPGANVTAVSRETDHIDVYAVDTAGHVQTTWWDANTSGGKWAQGWHTIPLPTGVTVPSGAKVTASPSGSSYMDLFVVDSTGTVYSTWIPSDSALRNFQYNPWFSLPLPPGLKASAGNAVAALRRPSSRVDIFVAGSNGTVYTTWWASDGVVSGWQSWTQVGSTAVYGQSLAVESRYANHVELFGISTSSGNVVNNWGDNADNDHNIAWANSAWPQPGSSPYIGYVAAETPTNVAVVTRNLNGSTTANRIDVFAGSPSSGSSAWTMSWGGIGPSPWSWSWGSAL
jgi:hypothetical protein